MNRRCNSVRESLQHIHRFIIASGRGSSQASGVSFLLVRWPMTSYELLEYLSPFEHDWRCKTEQVIHRIDYR